MGWGNEEKFEFKEPQNTELDVYQFEINEIANETLESTRNMRRMCEESKDMGQKTMGLLENQGESIENWEEVADKINEDMKMAEKALKDMDRACFGFIPRFWKVTASKYLKLGGERHPYEHHYYPLNITILRLLFLFLDSIADDK